MRKQWEDGQLLTREEIWSKEFAVKPELIKSYNLHLQDLEIQADITGRGRVERKNQQKTKSVHDYDWQQLIDSGGLIKRLRVPELNKYLVHHRLSSRQRSLFHNFYRS